MQACQIPKEILTSISSDNLINLYFKYPLFFNILSFPTLQNGMEDLKLNFNGYNEICSRSDVANLLLSRYLSISTDDLDSNWTSARKGSFAFKIISLELLLSQNEILQKLTYNDKKILIANAIMKLDEKRKNVQFHDYLGIKSSCYLIIEILQEFNLNKQFSTPDNINLLKTFSNSTSIHDDDKILQIIELSKNVIPNL